MSRKSPKKKVRKPEGTVSTLSRPRLYKLPRAAALLAMSLNTLKERIKEGAISVCYTGKASSKAGKGKRISEQELQRFIDSREVRSRIAEAS